MSEKNSSEPEDDPCATYSSETRVDQPAAECKFATPPPLVSTKTKPCHVTSLIISLYNGYDDDYYAGPEEEGGEGAGSKEGGSESNESGTGPKTAGFKALAELHREEPPEKAPERLKPFLNQYDLVLEVLAPASNRQQGQLQDGEKGPTLAVNQTGSAKGELGKNKQGVGKYDAKVSDKQSKPSTFDATAVWAASCHEAEHRNLIVSWNDDDGVRQLAHSPSGKMLSEAVYAMPVVDSISLHDPIGMLKQIFNHEQRTREYVMIATSCGFSPGKPALEVLKALVRAHPVDEWGVVIEFNAPIISLGWSPEASNKKREAKLSDAEAALKRIKSPKKPKRRIQNYRSDYQRAQTKKYLLKQEDDAKKTLKSLVGAVSYGYDWEKDTETPMFDFEVILNGRAYNPKTSYEEVRSAYKSISSIKDVIEKVKVSADALTEAFKFISDFNVAVVQPQFSLEVKFLSASMEFSSRYRILSSGERFVAMQRRWMLEGEAVIAEVSGTAALVVGKIKWGTGADLIGSITLSGKLFVEYKLHLDEVKSLASIWKQMKIEPKGEIDAKGSLQGRALAAGHELGSAGADVTGGVTFSEWKMPWRTISCVIHRHPVVVQVYANSDFSSKGAYDSHVLLEAHDTPWPNVWTFD